MARPLHIAALACAALGCNVDIYRVEPAAGRITGRVVDMDGDPLGGATVSMRDGDDWVPLVFTDAQGVFETAKLEGNHWFRVQADGYFSRVRPVGPEEQALFRLFEDDGSAVRIAFAGSTTFGAGFYTGATPVLEAGYEPLDVPAALAGVLPLLEGAQLTNLALEGPLSVHETAHPEKSAIYRQHPLVAPGLLYAGFDFAHLANDHSYDLMDHGLVETLTQLEAVGLSAQGAGIDPASAWAPAYRDVGAARVALLGCTTVTGADYEASLVAEENPLKAGAAACDHEWLDAMLAQASEQADLVVLQLHGGSYLDPTPSQAVASLTERAILGGADLVINHHPRVNGGISAQGGALVVESLGPLATDLTVWPSFPSSLLEVVIDRDGVVQRATMEPLLRDSLRPMAVLGWPRQRIARDIAAQSGAVVALDDGALEVDLAGRSQLEERRTELAIEVGSWSDPLDLRDGWLTEITGAEAWQVGTDLLRVGDFEDIDVDGDLAEGMLWDLDSSYEWFSDQAAYSGSYGLRLARDAAQTSAVWTSPAHRIPIEDTDQLTLWGQLRTQGTVEIQLSWYEGTSGGSFERSTHLLEPSDDWVPFVLELAPPTGATAVNVYIQLHPSDRGQVHADLDALRLVSWEPDQPDDLAPYDMLRVQGSAAYTMRRRVMPVAQH
jgi:hypothetical protein